MAHSLLRPGRALFGLTLQLRRLAILALVSALCIELVASQPNIDGGRSDLPGMKQDIFDQVNRQKKGMNQNRMNKAPPECPKSDKMSAFYNMAFVESQIFVRINSSEGPCVKLISIGGANFSELANASKTCGPAGEWKKRIAEEMSMVFFQGGYDSWVKSENETIEVVTEEGTIQAVVSEEKYAVMMECWKKSCDCDQAKNPKMRMVLFACLAIALSGLGYDSFKHAYASFKGTKPPKHVQCKKGHRIQEVTFAYSHICDYCRKPGTAYACQANCNFDLFKTCYKATKKKTKAKLKDWLEKHPDDPDNKKKKKDDEDDEDDDDKKKDEDSQSEAGEKCKKESEAESDAPPSTEDKEDTGAEDGENKTEAAAAADDEK